MPEVNVSLFPKALVELVVEFLQDEGTLPPDFAGMANISADAETGTFHFHFVWGEDYETTDPTVLQ